ncbi:tetratricopeptide repeat protein [candidate division KSB1 bacterium]|nr:tetratricopeptide repeat protein [candidate division KSB1 bacterium]
MPIVSSERRKIVDDARLTIGFVYYELGYNKDALEFFKDISAVHPEYKSALLGLSWSRYQLEMFAEAIESLQKIIQIATNSAEAEEAYFLLGQCYLKLNRYDDAIKAYEKIMELFPKTIDFSKYMQQIEGELGTKQKMVEQLETDLLVQESQLLDAIPVDGTGHNPAYLEEERKKVLKYQDALLQNIVSERRNLKEIRNIIDNLRERANRQYQRKDWRGYAEYGRARALYLKEMK